MEYRYSYRVYTLIYECTSIIHNAHTYDTKGYNTQDPKKTPKPGTPEWQVNARNHVIMYV